MEEITTLEQISALVESKDPVILFKYSPICGTSRVAQDVWETFAETPQAIRLAQCDVIHARAAARSVVELIGVMHQSPQMLVLKNGACLAHTSHYGITQAWMESAKEKLLRSP